MTSFLFAFGLVNLLTPVVLMNTDNSDYDLKQRLLMRNMFMGGVSLMFISLILAWM